MRLPRPIAGFIGAFFVLTGTLIYGGIVLAKHWSKP